MIEFSELQAIDFALGAHIAKAYRYLSRSAGPDAWKKFLHRPVNRQIFRSEIESPKDLLKAIWSSRKAEKSIAGGVLSNVPELPAVAYYRSPGMSHDDKGGVHHANKAWNNDLTKAFNLSIFPVVLDYKLMFLAWDKASLDKLQLAWYAFSSNVRAGNNVFPIKYRIAGELFDNVRAIIVDPKRMLFTNSSAGQAGGRLWAAETGLQLSTQVIYGDHVSPDRYVNRRGPCTVGEDYYVGDIVTVPEFTELEFICIKDHTAGGGTCPPYGCGVFWLLFWLPGSLPLNYRGVCTVGETYALYDVVSCSGEEYVCIVPHTATDGTCPPSDSGYWLLLPHWDDRWKWAEDVLYGSGNLVLWEDGCYYFCVQRHTADAANAPPDTDFWALFTCATQVLTVPVEVEIDFDLIGYCSYRGE